MSFYCDEKYVSDEDFENGSVVKAIDRFTGECVALKRWPDGRPEGAGEIAVWKSVYPELFKTSYEDGMFIYLVREWIGGVTLDRYRSSYAAFSARDALRLLDKIISGLIDFYGHSYAAHGDIKPENVIITEDENVLFIDFETAVAAKTVFLPEDGTDRKIETAKTACFASRAYSAPETYHGEITERSDVYSLGMLFLFLTEGIPARDKIAEMPPRYASFCRGCTDPEPALRFQNLRAVKTAIEALLKRDTDDRENGTENGPGNIIRVENMNVTAKTVRYASVQEDKIVLFPKNMAGYRRMILYVPENLSFASELAYMAAQLFGMKTGIFEICDYDSGALDYYLASGAERSGPFAEFAAEKSAEEEMRPLFSENIAYWEQAGLLAPCSEVPLLSVSQCDITAELALLPENLTDFAVWCYSHFDIAILADRAKLKLDQSVSLMRHSDFVIVPVKADIDQIETEKQFYGHFMKQYAIPRTKLRFIGWDYKEKCSAEHEAMVNAFGDSIYLGTVTYDSEREITKNLRGQQYCSAAAPRTKAQYSRIIQRFLFEGLKSA